MIEREVVGLIRKVWGPVDVYFQKSRLGHQSFDTKEFGAFADLVGKVHATKSLADFGKKVRAIREL